MIAGRPTNLWLGLTTAIVGAVQVTAVALHVDPTLVASLGGAWGLVIGAAVLLVAGQPPTVNAGDPIRIASANGAPPTTVAAPAPRVGDTERRTP